MRRPTSEKVVIPDKLNSRLRDAARNLSLSVYIQFKSTHSAMISSRINTNTLSPYSS